MTNQQALKIAIRTWERRGKRYENYEDWYMNSDRKSECSFCKIYERECNYKKCPVIKLCRDFCVFDGKQLTTKQMLRILKSKKVLEACIKADESVKK